MRGGPERARGAAGVRTRVLPETMFYPRKPDGVHACRPAGRASSFSTGEADVLADAFWFPERPGRAPAGLVPRPPGGRGARGGVANPLRGGAGRRDSRRSRGPSRSPRASGSKPTSVTLVAAWLLALSLAVVWQEARFWKVRHLEEAAAGGARPACRTSSAPCSKRATSSCACAGRTGPSRHLLHEPSQARLMGLVDRALPSAEAEFREWRYQQRELKVVVEDPDPDPIAYVRALEAEPLFEQVKAEPARGDEGRLEITLRVRGEGAAPRVRPGSRRSSPATPGCAGGYLADPRRSSSSTASWCSPTGWRPRSATTPPSPNAWPRPRPCSSRRDWPDTARSRARDPPEDPSRSSGRRRPRGSRRRSSRPPSPGWSRVSACASPAFRSGVSQPVPDLPEDLARADPAGRRLPAGGRAAGAPRPRDPSQGSSSSTASTSAGEDGTIRALIC